MGIAESYSVYSKAVGDKFTQVTSSLNPNQKKLAEAYVNWVKAQTAPEEGKPAPATKFAQWLDTDAGKAAKKDVPDADIEFVKGHFDRDASIGGAYDKMIKDGKYVAEEASNWMGDNWTMLAALGLPALAMVAGPMIGLEIGIIPAIIMAVAGLGAAAAFGPENSVLGKGYEYVKKETNGFWGLTNNPNVKSQIKDDTAITGSAVNQAIFKPVNAKAKAQADFATGKVKITGYEQTSDLEKVVVSVDSISNPKEHLMLQGTVDDKGTVTLTKNVTRDADGKLGDITLKKPIVIPNVGKKDEPKKIDRDKLMPQKLDGNNLSAIPLSGSNASLPSIQEPSQGVSLT